MHILAYGHPSFKREKRFFPDWRVKQNGSKSTSGLFTAKIKDFLNLLLIFPGNHYTI